jgi:hypothetical protein
MCVLLCQCVCVCVVGAIGYGPAEGEVEKVVGAETKKTC